MKVGCYTLDLYCDNRTDAYPDPPHKHDEFPHVFTGRTEASCLRLAVSRGWKITRSKEICPSCAAKES